MPIPKQKPYLQQQGARRATHTWYRRLGCYVHLGIKMVYCSNTKWARRFRCEDDSLAYIVRGRLSKWGIQALFLSNKNNNHIKVHQAGQALLVALLFRLKCSRKVPGYSTLIGDKAPPGARDRSKLARAQNVRCYSHTGNGGHSWCLSGNLSLSVGLSIKDEARSVLQGAHYHDVDWSVISSLGTHLTCISSPPQNHASGR